MTLPDSSPSPPLAKRVVTARDRRERLLRIEMRIEEGWSYEAIARAENLTRERIRQIVSESLDQRDPDPARRHKLLQLARLAPALRVTGESIMAGDAAAVRSLVLVLDRIDKYQPQFVSDPAYDRVVDRKEIIRKLNLMAEPHRLRQEAEKAAFESELKAARDELSAIRAAAQAQGVVLAPLAAPEPPATPEPPAEGRAAEPWNFGETSKSVVFDP